MKHINELSHQIAACADAMLHTSDKKVAHARVMAMGGVMCTVFMLGLSGAANATSLENYATTVSGKTNVIVDIISYICYIGGAGLAALGIVDLKKHVENPQTPVKQGLAKLGFGGMLLTLPYITNLMQSTTGASGNGATFNKFTTPPTI